MSDVESPGKEWNAEVYHRISRPQQSWGPKVIGRLQLRGDETVLDAGCGSGRLTAELLELLPNGKVIALDRSQNMLDEARAFLDPRFPGQVTYIQADLGALDPAAIPGPIDAMLSTATFHWVRDHERLFAGLAAPLKPGGQFVAQCGGGPNIKRLVDRADTLIAEEPCAPFFARFTSPFNFAGPEITAERLPRAGFTGIDAWLEDAPVILESELVYREFLTNIVFHPYLEVLPDPTLRDAFIERLVEQGRADDPPYLLDYVRLNIVAIRAND